MKSNNCMPIAPSLSIELIASLLYPVTFISIHYWAIPTYSLTNCTNWWVDPGSSDLGMYYREHPD